MTFERKPYVACSKCEAYSRALNGYGVCADCWMRYTPEQRTAAGFVEVVERHHYHPVSYFRVILASAITSALVAGLVILFT